MGDRFEATSFAEPIKFLMDFISEMHHWQLHEKQLRRAIKNGTMSYAEMLEILNQELKGVYDKYVKYKGFPRLVFSSSYDPQGEKVIEVSKEGGKILIITDQTTNRPRRKVRYTLVETADGLKISENRKRYDEYEQKYVPWDLLL